MIIKENLKLLTEDELSILFFIINDFGAAENFDFTNIIYHRLETLAQKMNTAREKIKPENIGHLDSIWNKITGTNVA